MASSNFLGEFMSLNLRELQDLCIELELSPHGKKLVLAVRVANSLASIDKAKIPDKSTIENHLPTVSPNWRDVEKSLIQQIQDLDDQIGKLTTKQEIDQYQHEISAYHAKLGLDTKQSTPHLDNKAFTPHINATSNEPFVAGRRKQPRNSASDHHIASSLYNHGSQYESAQARPSHQFETIQTKYEPCVFTANTNISSSESLLISDLPIVPPPPAFESVMSNTKVWSCPPPTSGRTTSISSQRSIIHPDNDLGHSYPAAASNHSAMHDSTGTHSQTDHSLADKISANQSSQTYSSISHPVCNTSTDIRKSVPSLQCYSDSHSKQNVLSSGNSLASPYASSDSHVSAAIDPGAKAIAFAIHATKTPDLDVFTGDSLKYNDWNKAFARYVDNNPTYTELDKLFHFRRFTGGEISPIVEGYYALDDINAYAKIRKVIHDRYGNPLKLSQAYQSKLAAWPNITSDDTAGLQRFADYLRTLCTAMLSVPNLDYLDHSSMNAKLKQLLPTWLKRKWNDKAIEYTNSHGNQFPPFRIFADFVAGHADKLNHPIALEGEHKSQAQKPKVSKVVCHSAQSHSRVTDSTVSEKVHSVKRAENILVCVLCKGSHRLYKCDSFKDKSGKDRHTFCVNNKICFSCLNVHAGDCKMKIFCKSCDKHANHNSLLHEVVCANKPSMSNTNKSKASQPVRSLSTCHTTKSDSGLITCHMNGSTSMIVPVYISHKSKPNQEILTYAMLDLQSVFTFVTDDLASKLAKPFASTTIGLSTMTSLNEPVKCNLYSDLVVRGFNQSELVSLKSPHGCQAIPNDLKVPTQLELSRWPHLRQVADQFPPVLDVDVGILIGHDSHYASFPDERVRPPSEDEPYAVKTPLGWTLVGPISHQSQSSEAPRIMFSHKVSATLEVPASLRIRDGVENPPSNTYHLITQNPTAKESAVPMDIIKQLEEGFVMKGDNDLALESVDDAEFMATMKSGIYQDGDRLYSMPLPFRGGKPPIFPNNKMQAVARFKALENKFKDADLLAKYQKFMSDLLEQGDAELVPAGELQAENRWYLPHHSVTNPKKPDKVRIVFDASCTYKGASLNSSLLQGPDLNNTLVGVLTRFRERDIAVACDIERMFYRFRVHPEHRDFLRFLWYGQDGSLNEYRMTKHIFGATSSPGCSKYGLIQMAKDLGKDKEVAAWFIEHCFYVDDGLFSVDSTEEAVHLLADTRSICSKAGLKLHKLMANSPEVLRAFPEADLACSLTLFEGEVSVTERALGIQWSPVEDIFSFSSNCISSALVSRRQMLKIVASLFDPLGFISPIVLLGKRILQRACHGLDWDDPVPQDIANEWNAWLSDLQNLSQIKIPRCLKPSGFGSDIIRTEVHTFTDASEKGYGMCMYLRMINSSGSRSSLLFSKARVVPLKGSTIPRLELQAAVLGAKVASQIVKELSIQVSAQYFWSDSKIVLAYLQNTRKKLNGYVRNRVIYIRDTTDTNSWNYVKSEQNPADIASRGCNVDHLHQSQWFHGPAFINSSLEMSAVTKSLFEIPDDDDVEVKAVSHEFVAHTVVSKSSVFLESIERVSSWKSAIKLCCFLLHIKNKRGQKYTPDIADLKDAESLLLRHIQQKCFKAEVDAIARSKGLASTSSIYQLDPYLDQDGLLRVGGRAKLASTLVEGERHPIIIPKNNHLCMLLVRHYHDKCGHQGRGMTMSYVRAAGYWVVNLPSTVASYIHKCIDCRKLRRKTETQKMSDLPTVRVNASDPFTNVGIDCFGPFEVKEGRRYTKKYGVLFTCLYSRGIHVEVCDDMSTDAFINSLRTFMALRGRVSRIYCDRGSNFVGASNELAKALSVSDNTVLKRFFESHGCEFVFNSPMASEMGGVWERQIRTFRSVLNGLSIHCRTYTLDSSSIRTLFYECMNIVNSRPITAVEADGIEPLTPNHLILMKSSIVLPPPPGHFTSTEQYSRKRWRRVQALVDLFWKRWKSQYFCSLQRRQCWNKSKTFQVGDLVLLKDVAICRGQWSVGRISSIIVSADGRVRRAKVMVGDRSFNPSDLTTKPTQFKVTVVERPVTKIVLLMST